MTKPSKGGRKNCSHGNNINGYCPGCVMSNAYAQRDASKITELYGQVSLSSFKLAAILAEGLKRWKEYHKLSAEKYFKEIVKFAKLDLTFISLKQIYYTGKTFPDLLCGPEPKLSFTCYREIAIAAISEEGKKKVRQMAEEEKMTSSDVRRLIKNQPKKEKPKTRKKQEIEAVITYHSDNDFIKKIKEDFLDKYKENLYGGVPINLKFKIREGSD